MANKVNLNKLKEEIDSRKRDKGQLPSNIGEGISSPKDKFLNGLLISLNTGKDTVSTNLIKTVDNTVSQRLGESTKLKVSENISHEEPRTMPKSTTPVEMSPEREEQMWQEFQRSKKQTLAEQMSGYINNHQQGYQQPTTINEGALINNVKTVVDKYLMENFGTVVEDAIKSTILEMYAAEKIKEVLNENRELIKSVVIETIREIQAKNKAKKN
jgi:hypothetical protein